MSEIDQQFIEYVVKSLVGHPEAVHIDRRIDEKGVLLELTVDPEDLGRVIGKKGATAQSLRTLLRALGTKNDARYNLKIIDNGPYPRDSGRPATSDDTPVATTPADDSTDDSAAQPEEEAPAEPEAKPAEPPEAPAAEEQPQPETADRFRQTREELADLDDLDV
jgi:predicted RNA-binding protein YlqC (UPF0109 family)